jgi:hypothetical protein
LMYNANMDNIIQQNLFESPWTRPNNIQHALAVRSTTTMWRRLQLINDAIINHFRRFLEANAS